MLYIYQEIARRIFTYLLGRDTNKIKKHCIMRKRCCAVDFRIRWVELFILWGGAEPSGRKPYLHLCGFFMLKSTSVSEIGTTEKNPQKTPS